MATHVMTSESAEKKALLAAGVTVIFWSSAFAGIRLGLTGYSPLPLTLFRFLCASVVFLIYAIIKGIPTPRREDLASIFFLGLFGITFYHTALNLGEVSVPAGTASLIIATAPVFTVLFSRLWLKEKFRPLGWLGIALSFSGVAIMARKGDGDLAFTQGAFLILLSAIFTSVYFVGLKPLFARYSPIRLTAYVTWAGTVPLLVFLPQLGPQLATAPAAATIAAIYIGVFPAAAAYAAWSMVLKELPPGRASSFLYLSPPLAILFGFLLLGEVPQVVQLVGGMLALSGVIVVNRWGKEAPTTPSMDGVRRVDTQNRTT